MASVMDPKRVRARSAKNKERRDRLLQASAENHEVDSDKILRKVVVRDDDGDISYELYFKKRKRHETISMGEAERLLPAPVLFYLGVKNGRSVDQYACDAFGLLCTGEEQSSRTWGILRDTERGQKHWVPTHLRKDKDGIFHARDKRTDGQHEWHDDVLLWSLSGIGERGWDAALECTALADESPFNDRIRYHLNLDWLAFVDAWCSDNVEKSLCIEEGVGCRSMDAKLPPSGFSHPLLRMEYYSPLFGCLVAAAAALIKEGGGDVFAARKLRQTNRIFSGLSSFQIYLQGECRTGWSADRVTCVDNMIPQNVLAFILGEHRREQRGLYLVRLSAWNCLSKHVVGVDVGLGIIWDSCETRALNLTRENLEYCCGSGARLRGILEVRILRSQAKTRKRGRSSGSSGKRRKFFKR